jgi:hypothetical protein
MVAILEAVAAAVMAVDTAVVQCLTFLFDNNYLYYMKLFSFLQYIVNIVLSIVLVFLLFSSSIFVATATVRKSYTSD